MIPPSYYVRHLSDRSPKAPTDAFLPLTLKLISEQLALPVSRLKLSASFRQFLSSRSKFLFGPLEILL